MIYHTLKCDVVKLFYVPEKMAFVQWIC